MNSSLQMREFLQIPSPTFDVRSENEYLKGHLPGSVNLPLFNDQERSLVGTCYKTKGRNAAVLLGLKLAGPKLTHFIEKALTYSDYGFCKVLCWRGGLRSQSMTWLLNTAGFEVKSLAGGYKAFRKWVLSVFDQTFNFKILGGLTGSGKTTFLKYLEKNGEQIIDLEELAGHRGSAFGLLGMPAQISTEHFENCLAVALAALDQTKPIWLEDESRMIGLCNIPKAFFEKMQAAPLYFLEREKTLRIEHLIQEYGAFPKEELIFSVGKISKKLGGSRAKEIMRAIELGDLKKAVSYLLEYYDKAYLYGLRKRKTIFSSVHSDFFIF